MARKKRATKCELEKDPVCKYVVDAWANRHKNNIDSYLRGAIRVNPTSQVSDELRFLCEVAAC
jgi:hypothetical protein